jgi:TetR/AcrR family transcriptional repressor of bet genes
MQTKRRDKPAFSRKSANDRRRQLIDAGIVCLAKGGMSAFTIDQICREAGVSRGLINHHFTSKDELLVRIYADMTDHLVNGAERFHSMPPLVAIVEQSFDEASFNRSNLRAWLSIWGQVASNPELNALHRQRYSSYSDRIKSALGEASATLDIDSVARQFIALIDGLWLEYCLNSEGFSLGAAKQDCYRFLRAYGIEFEAVPQGRCP